MNCITCGKPLPVTKPKPGPKRKYCTECSTNLVNSYHKKEKIVAQFNKADLAQLTDTYFKNGWDGGRTYEHARWRPLWEAIKELYAVQEYLVEQEEAFKKVGQAMEVLKSEGET